MAEREKTNEELLDDYATAVSRAERREERCDGSEKHIRLCEEASACCVNVRAAVLARMSSGWQDISTAPKDGTFIIVCRMGEDIGTDPMEIVNWCEFKRTDYEPAENGLFRRVVRNERGFWNGNGHRATHWMPLPPSPTTTEGNAP